MGRHEFPMRARSQPEVLPMLVRSSRAAERACNETVARQTRTVALLPSQSILVDQRGIGHLERPLLSAGRLRVNE